MNTIAGRIMTALFPLALLWVAPQAETHAAIPHKINYQGYLTNSAGTPVNTTLGMMFQLWDVPSGGVTALHTETQLVKVTNGAFSVVLGTAPALTLPFDVPYYLGITVAPDALEMSPRQLLTAAPYAIRSGTSEALAANGANCAAGQFAAGVDAQGNAEGCASPAGGGTVSSITVGTGLSGGTITTTGTIAADTNYLQRRVSGTCAVGSYISGIAADGTVSCATDANSGGTVSTVNAGAGLAGGPISTTGTISIANGGVTAAMLASNSCSTGAVLKWNGSTWACSADDAGTGTVTSITAGTGLNGGTITSSGTVSVAADGITATELAANAVTTAKLADGSVTDAKIAAVAATKLSGTVATASGGTGLSAAGAVGNVLRSDGAAWTSAPATGLPGTLQWQVVLGGAQQAQSHTGYLANDINQVTITLPSAPGVGDTVRVSGAEVGGWKIAQNAGQTISGTFFGLGPPDIWAARESSRDWRSVASSADGNKLVAVALGGQIYTSTDSGVTWSPHETARSWFSVVSSSDGSKLVAGVLGGQIHTSTDSGTTWTPRDSSRAWRAIASSSDGSKLVAGTEGGQIYTSTDSGATWTPRETARAWRSVASSADGTKLVAGDYDGVVGGRIYISTDSGATWTPTGPVRFWYAVASSADGSKLVAAEVGGQIYTSIDSGANWTPRDSNRSWYSVTSSADGSKLAAVVNNGQIYTSTDSGATWTPRDFSRGWYSVASSADGSKLVAGTSIGQLYSSFVPIGIASTTTPGTAGYLSGAQSSAVELQYVGSGRFIALSSAGVITSR